MREDRERVPEVYRVSRAYLFLLIIASLNDAVASAIAASAVRGGRIVAHVVDLSTRFARSPPTDAIDDRLFRNFERNHPIDFTTELSQHRVQRNRLIYCPRVTI